MVGGSTKAILATGAVFAAFHLPNPLLTVLTLVGGLLFAALFTRLPNVFAAAVAHVLVSGLISRTLPEEITRGMKVGPYYWTLAGGG
jgi:membrane protease YdiL (CAAX protease family)